MNLYFLCPYHEQLVLKDKNRAEELWHGLMVHGKIEAGQHHWARAASYFGSSAETALLIVSMDHDQQRLASLNKLRNASQFLIDSLCRIGDFESAKMYTRELWLNGDSLFSQSTSPISKPSTQPFTRTKKREKEDIEPKEYFADSINMCYETIKEAENEQGLQNTASSQCLRTHSRSLASSNISIMNQQRIQKHNSSQNKNTSKYAFNASNHIH